MDKYDRGKVNIIVETDFIASEQIHKANEQHGLACGNQFPKQALFCLDLFGFPLSVWQDRKTNEEVVP